MSNLFLMKRILKFRSQNSFLKNMSQFSSRMRSIKPFSIQIRPRRPPSPQKTPLFKTKPLPPYCDVRATL